MEQGKASDDCENRIFDVIVIGAGPGGEDSTIALLEAGLSVAMVEPERIGGECFNWACVPSKAMLRPGHALRAASRLPGAADVTGTQVRPGPALEHRDDIVSHRDDTDEVERFTALGARFFRAHGRIAGQRTVVASSARHEQLLTARHAVIVATGSTTVVPDLPGLGTAAAWTNREATSVTRVPRRLAVLGAGAVGLEMAQAWRSLGSEEVTVLVRNNTLLPRHEPFVGDLVHRGLREAGVEFRFDTTVARVHRDEHGVALHLADGALLVADELLVATGKKAASAGVGLDTVGGPSDGFVSVADDMTVGGSDWLYAVGDVNGRALLTHEASYQARIAAAAIIARVQGRPSTFLAYTGEGAVPQVIFTDPEVATVGLTLEQAEGMGLRAQRHEADIGAVIGAQLHADGYTGRASITVDDDRGVMVGATFVGQDATDMVHAATVAIVGEVPVERLRHATPAFPTISEVWLDLLKNT